MSTLLDRVRGVSKLILQSHGETVRFSELAGALSEAMDSNVYIVDSAGKLLGFTLGEGFVCSTMDELIRGSQVPEEFVSALLRYDETRANIKDELDRCIFDKGAECPFEYQINTFIPIANRGERLGTLILTSFGSEFREDDLVLGEYCATVIGVELMRLRIEHADENERKKTAVDIVMKTLSYSEMLAIEAVFQELDGDEGIITATKIADQAGITRSVIVNALRKLESAGIVNSRSLGMKGTYIKILNQEFLKKIEEATD